MTNPDDAFPFTFSRADRRRFSSMVRAASSRAGLQLTGTIPDLRTPDGGELSLRNLIAECAQMPTSRWKDHIRWWFGVIADSSRRLDELGVMSHEVAAASLRIRLLPPSGAPEYTVSRPSLPGLAAVLYVRRTGFGHSVKPEMLEQWGFDVEEAFDIARANSLEKEEFRTIHDGPLLEIDGSSNYASTRVLALSDVAGLEGSMRDTPFVVSVPTRNCVLVAPIDRDGWPLAPLLLETMTRFSAGPGATSPRAWFASRDSFGTWGEGAEPIDVELVSDADADDDVRVRIHRGPRLTDYLEHDDLAA